MLLKSFVLVSMLYVATANDIRLGYAAPSSKKIFSEIREANPALWTRTDDVIINTVGSEVISAVSVTDLRDNKDGEAYIESGGLGGKSVTIGLKSPSVLRGYKFEIEVYADDPKARYYSKGGVNYNPNAAIYTKGGLTSAPYIDDGQFPRKY